MERTTAKKAFHKQNSSAIKGRCNKTNRFSVWQKSFNEHIVRGEKDYKEIYEYISENPARLKRDNL